YAPITKLAMHQGGTGGGLSTFGFVLQLFGRSLAWALAGTAMGLGQGLALRSKRLLIYGLVGGVAGGLFGGLLFDPIYFLIVGSNSPSAHWSRLVGLAVIGAAVGAMIGIVELLARDAWLRMTQGPLSGKEFLIFKDTMKIGSSPKSDIYLFNDAAVAPHHATLRAVGDACEIECEDSVVMTLLNGRSVRRSRLRHGDEITIGRTVFLFQSRQG
ncbi:MAG TPA: FHA domain-containing protein, partial [Blastocatellia bacterium]|nr:FHA domain-containing protein [Blastocatellia bacterium]